MVRSKEITLARFPRGIHLITGMVTGAIGELPQEGLLHLFIKHTSAALLLSENADPDVRLDLEEYLDRLVREREPYYRHTQEGSDDMPAHIKAALTGKALSIPITGGQLALGTWQGICLCEFRNNGGQRRIVATVIS